MGNTQQTQENEKSNITSRKKECEKFNACDKDKLYRELKRSKTIPRSPRRNSKSSRKSKGSKKSRSSRKM